MLRQSSQGFDVLARDEEGHRRRSVLGGVKGPVRRSGVRRSEAILARLGSGVAFPAAIYGFDAVASINLRDGDPEQHFLMYRFLRCDPRQLRYLGGPQEWFGAGSGRSIWGRWWRFGSHSRACP